MEDIVSKANQWALDVWTKAVPNWKERNQDHNYRDVLARPGIYTALKSVSPKIDGQFLEIGCGDGAETFYIRDSLVKLGWSGKMFGYDLQSQLVSVAERANSPSPIPIQFGDGSIGEFLERYNLIENVDLVTSVFVLQDLPDIHKYLANVDKVLGKDGVGVFLLVHPDFGEAMREKGGLKIKRELNPRGMSVPWRWACEYPIVEENGGTFSVPYFQRTIRDYEDYFRKHFSQIETIALKPSTGDIKRSEKEHMSPFYNHLGNVYYPEIVERDSSLVIIARR